MRVVVEEKSWKARKAGARRTGSIEHHRVEVLISRRGIDHKKVGNFRLRRLLPSAFRRAMQTTTNSTEENVFTV